MKELDKNDIENFIKEGKTAWEICEYFNCCRSTLIKYCKKFEIITPKKGFYLTGKKIGRPEGIPLSEDLKRSISERVSGENNPFYGKKHSKETKEKMSKNHADFIGENNPFKKSLENPENLDKLKQRIKDNWQTGKRIKERQEYDLRVNCVYKDIPRNYWTRYINNAKLRNFEFSITPEEVWDCFKSQNEKCALSGLKLNFGFPKENITASIDRIDSKLGYTKENIQIVHKAINWMKADLVNNEFLDICCAIAEFSRGMIGEKTYNGINISPRRKSINKSTKVDE